ncbi:hypothetical protein J6X73_01380 [Candidatus Saccharibacteria bacterium]|nr:hypothetical protein [Candidatus Saccharibacteria bacterium]
MQRNLKDIFVNGTSSEPATKEEVMARYWGRFDVLDDGEGYDLRAEGVLTPYSTHFSNGRERPVTFAIKGVRKFVADGKVHWPLEEVGDCAVNDDAANPHVYRRLARRVVKEISDMGRGVFGNIDTNYGVIAGDIRHNDRNTSIVFEIAGDPEHANFVMLYANKPLNWFAGTKNWDMLEIGNDFWAVFIPMSVVASVTM